MVADHAIALASGQKVEDYVIESVLGEGGFGITYLARQEALNKVFAVKEYLPRQIATRTANGAIRTISERDADQFAHGLDRFLDEARIMAQFSHPNIVQVQNFFEANGTAYLVMDYGEGQTLDEDLARRPLMDEAELRAILMPLLDGLGTMHAADVLHRDIKPGNVFIRRDKGPMWLDFGAARRCAGGRSGIRSCFSCGRTSCHQPTKPLNASMTPTTLTMKFVTRPAKPSATPNAAMSGQGVGAGISMASPTCSLCSSDVIGTLAPAGQRPIM